MSKAVAVIGIVILMALSAGGGYLLGEAGVFGPLNIAGLGITQGTQTIRFDASQMTPEQLEQMRQARGGEFRGGMGVQPGDIGANQGVQPGELFAGGTFGTITAIEDDTLTIQTQNEAITVKVSDTTLIEKQMSVDIHDLLVGEQVAVSGSANEDGSTTARSIRVLANVRQ